MSLLLAKPKAGLTLRDPRTRLIVPEDGVLVPEHDPFWQSLANMGDVELTAPPNPEQAAADALAPALLPSTPDLADHPAEPAT